MDSEEDCKKYLEALRKGETPMRIFTRRIPKGKLGDKKKYILEEKSKGRSDADIAHELNVSYSAVHRLVIGDTFRGRIDRRNLAKHKNDKDIEAIERVLEEECGRD